MSRRLLESYVRSLLEVESVYPPFSQEALLRATTATKGLKANDAIEKVLDYVRAPGRPGIKFLGAGSSRIVYEVEWDGSPLALKVALNPAGISQNRAETASSERWAEYQDILAVVRDVEPSGRYLWILSDRVKSVGYNEFENLSEMYWDGEPDAFVEKLSDYLGGDANEKDPEEEEESEFLCRVVSFARKSQAKLGDLIVLDHWGRVEDRLVVLDYGFTEEVWEKHYKSAQKTQSHDSSMTGTLNLGPPKKK